MAKLADRYSKSALRYWEEAIFLRRRRRNDGRIYQSQDCRIQLQHQGRRGEFNLTTSNKSAAARQAREISEYLRNRGWKLTLKKYKPADLNDQRVYFAGAGEEVKIGMAINPRRRVETMQAGRPNIMLLGSISGGREVEKHLHQRFSRFHIAGEWFHFSEQIKEAIKELLSLESDKAAGQAEVRNTVKPPAKLPQPPRKANRPPNSITRPALADRWRCHIETLRRREREGQLHPIQLGERMIRYSMREVREIEHQAAATRVIKAQEKGTRPGQR